MKERKKDEGSFSQNAKPNQSKSIVLHYELQTRLKAAISTFL